MQRAKLLQLYPTPCDPMDYSLPGSSVHEILQARILEWVVISFSRGSSRPRDRTRVSCIGVRHFNLWATLFIIGEIQIKTTVSFPLILVSMAIIKKSTNNKCWRGYREKGTLLHCWWECKLIQSLWRPVWNFLERPVIKLSYDPTVPLPCIYPEEPRIENFAWNSGHASLIPGSRRSPGKGNGNPLQYSCLENPMDGGAWWATVHGLQRVRHDWATELNWTDTVLVFSFLAYFTLHNRLQFHPPH